MLPDADLSIIVVSWNTRDLLAQCLESLFANPPGCPFEVTVVDNASSDGSAALVRQRFRQVLLLENSRNIGFAIANNQALRRSRGRYLLLLNPDTRVLPGALAELVHLMERRADVGAAGSRLLNPDGSLQPSCHPEPTLTREFWRLFHLDRLRHYALYPMEEWDLARPRDVHSAQGASLILRRRALEEIGVLDDGYFVYSEEVDLCSRLRRHGWRVCWAPQSPVVHYGGQSTRQVAPAMFLQLYRAKAQYLRKRYGAAAGWAYRPVLAAAAVARLLGLMPSVLRRGTASPACALACNYARLLRALPSL